MYKFLLGLLLSGWFLAANAQQGKITITGKVSKAEDGEALEGVFIQSANSNNYALTSVNGSFALKGQPFGPTILNVSLLGRKPVQIVINPKADTTLNITMEILSLALKEISVLSRQRKIGSSSILDKSAIKHRQPTSLSDALQLVPGQLAINPDLSSAQQIILRQVPSASGTNQDAARANSLGTAIVLDGIPLSNNGNMQSNVNILNSSPGSLAPFSSVAGRGNDLRQIPADQIESIEVITGIPSVRYGDLTTGVVLVNTRAGVFGPQFTTRVNPTLIQQTAGFGTKLGGKGGIINIDNDLTYAVEDPRNTLSQYTRLTSQLTWSKPWQKNFFTTTKLALLNTLDNNKQDPDDLTYQRKVYSRDNGFRFSTNGKLNSPENFLKYLNYDIGVSYSHQKSYVQELTVRDLFPVTAVEEDYTGPARYGESEYLSKVTVSGKALSLYGRLEGMILNSIMVGAEYRYDGNRGEGRMFDATRPPRQNYSVGDRPRSYDEIPALDQIAYYIEKRLEGKLFNRSYQMVAGLRYDNIAPQNPFVGKFGNVLAPRVNFAIEAIPTLKIKGGYGITSKSPTLSYLYPGKRYFDLVNFNYHAENPDERLVVMTTRVFDTINENIRSYKAQKFEVGLDLENEYLDGYVTGYHEISRGAYGTDRTVTVLNVEKYEAIEFPAGKPPVLSPTPSRVDPFYAAMDVSANNRRIENTGLEFQIRTKPISWINTSFDFSGAYISTVSYDEGNAADATRAVFSNVAPNRIGIFSSGYGNKGQRFNTTLGFVTRIPGLNFLLSGLAQTIWLNTSSGIDLSPYAIGYMDKTGNTVFLSQEESMRPEYQDIMRPLNSSLRFIVKQPPLWLFNIEVTKELKNNSSFSFKINNVPAELGRYYDPSRATYIQRNQNLFFSAEFTIKL
ncbi:MAG: TonB-dependent receptor [Pedobacter sp.]